MNSKELFYFVARCLAVDETPAFKEEVIRLSKNELINWPAFVNLCSNQLILPTIYIKFKNHDIIEHLPEEVAEHLFEIYELNTQRNQNIIHQIEEINKILNTNNIQPIFIKGAANLLDELYSDLAERMLADIDFLVQEKDFLKTAKILEMEGYSVVEETTDYSDYEELTDFKHYPKLVHPDFEAVVEIHREPVEKKYSKWFNTKIINSEKKTVKKAGCFIPSDKHKIIHNFIHTQLSDEGYLYGNIALRDIYDLLLLSKRFSPITALKEIKPKKKAIAYFALADEIFGLNKELFAKRNAAFYLLRNKHSLNFESSTFYHGYRSTIFISQRIFRGYLGRPIKAIYSKKEREAFTKRLRSPQWFRNHLTLYSDFFRIGNKKKSSKK